MTHYVSGTCYEGKANHPASRTIYAYNQISGEVIGFTTTNQFGIFSINVPNGDLVFLRIVDPSGIYTTEIRENITPTIIP